MKRFTLIFLVLIVTLLSASIAAAQEPGTGQPPTGAEEGERPGRGERGERGGRPGGRGHRGLGAVAEQLGVEREEIREFIEANEGVTLAQVIENFGGDVQAFIDAKVAAIVERSGRDEAEVRAEVEERVNQAIELRGDRPAEGDEAPADGDEA